MSAVEQWLAIAGYEGRYEVSDQGRIRSLSRLNTRGRRLHGRILKPRVAHHGHLTVALYNERGRSDLQIHFIVLTAFVGPRPDGMDACHWNDVPSDNRVENLRWDTRSANVLDAVRNGHHAMSNRTHCPQGHEYRPANTYHYPAGNRACNECRRIYREEHYEQRREQGRRYRARKRAEAREQSTTAIREAS